MEGFVWLLILVTGAIFGIPLLVHRLRGSGQSWGLLAAEAHAHEVFRGEVDGFEKRLETYEQGAGENRRTRSRLVLGGRGRVAPELALAREAGFQGLRKALGNDDLQLEEGDFDAAVHVDGPEDVTLASLGPQARRRVMDFVAAGGEVRLGDLHFPLEGVANEAQVRELLDLMVATAKALSFESVPAALLANFKAEQNPRLRLRCLKALASGYSIAPETLEALRAGLAAPEPEVKLLAALNLPPSPEVQSALERVVDSREAPLPLRAAALERLSALFPYPSIATAVRRALFQDLEPLRSVAVEAAGRGKDETQLAQLKTFVLTTDEALGAAAAHAFAAIGGPEAEAGLLAMLGNGADAVRREAVVGLGKIGTVRCVEPLLPLTKGALGDAARDAVRAIQARLGDADGGRLSVVDGNVAEGGLSLDSKQRERP